ncbi:GerAB/ArcD/ProY family transporter [Neobacillus terrae]|uniref:GerAB/ArcD/ProY family transporter n=1 Tax=Neobacillus terrae TaxID=3034837 RepID=UPI00140ACFC0|nr:endospore germination permease [Neobacillus terrae]NHM33777.1 endospore germination permease [Neobacillus terrae]
MKPRISAGQFSILIANFIFSVSAISLPQVLIKSSGHYSWVLAPVTLPVFFLFVFIIIGRAKNQEQFKNIFVPDSDHSFVEKIFYLCVFLFMALILIRDLRGFVDFVAAVLLPNTPIDILVTLSLLVILYVTVSGLEVIARVTVIQFVILGVIVAALPLLLLNEIQIGNLQPILGMEALPGVFKSSYILFSWVGEVVFIVTIIAHVEPIKKIRKAAFQGIGIIYTLLCILLATEIGVLGTKILEVSTYPSHQLIQQINLTDFLDRLDVFIVVVWLPNIFTKLALALFCLNKALSCLVKRETNVYILPVSLILGHLSILLFKNNINQIDFSFYTWPTLGSSLEIILLALFILIKWQRKKKLQNKTT